MICHPLLSTRQSGVDVRVARIFNTYGPRMHMNDGRVVSNFVLSALREEPITIYGSGRQTRSFQYVTDLVDGLVALMASNYTKPVNIGNPTERTIEGQCFYLVSLAVAENALNLIYLSFHGHSRVCHHHKEGGGR